MNFYDILQDGFHTPLNANQIADLFHAGRLGRNTPCKRAEKKEWRTIDELFPLLKYDSSRRFAYQNRDAGGQAGGRRHFAVAACFAGVLGLVLILFFALRDDGNADRFKPPVEATKPDSPGSQRIWTNTPQTVVATPQNSASVVAEVPAHLIDNSAQFRQAEEQRRAQSQAELAGRQRQAEEQQRQQAELVRRQEERARQEAKAQGQNVPVPLDRDVTISVGGIPVRVMVHDNDVTSFDVWINGSRRREVPKRKGISQTGTDETLIYGTGRASLYYVWEPSEKVNHCLLRVRED